VFTALLDRQSLTINYSPFHLQRVLPQDNTPPYVVILIFGDQLFTFQQDNTRYALLQMDDRVLVYRGADQPDMSVINPEANVWQHIKVMINVYVNGTTDKTKQMPQTYLARNWPIRYCSLSNDGRLIAIAGRRGLAHYNSNSGRWKLFLDQQQEQAFVVKGGLLWFHHILIAAIEMGKTHQVSRRILM
jgi:hypothetical protein